MCPRQYRLGRRASSIEENRGAILDSAARLFVEAGFHRTSVEDVARFADVAAATVYYQFGSKAGLLQALVADVQARAGRHLLDPLLHLPDPVESLHAYVRESCRLWDAEPALFRVFDALAAADSTIRPLFAIEDEAQHRQAWSLARRLAERDPSSNGEPSLQSAAALRMLTDFQTFDQLSARGGLSLERTIEMLVALVSAVLPSNLRGAPQPTPAMTMPAPPSNRLQS